MIVTRIFSFSAAIASLCAWTRRKVASWSAILYSVFPMMILVFFPSFKWEHRFVFRVSFRRVSPSFSILFWPIAWLYLLRSAAACFSFCERNYCFIWNDISVDFWDKVFKALLIILEEFGFRSFWMSSGWIGSPRLGFAVEGLCFLAVEGLETFFFFAL